MEGLVADHKVAINALDFTSAIPLQFDHVCKAHKIPVLHPYNLGWAGLAIVIDPHGMPLTSIENADEKFNELTVVEYVSKQMKRCGTPQDWLDGIIEKYLREEEQLSPPQLSIGRYFLNTDTRCYTSQKRVAEQSPRWHRPF